MEDVAQAIDYLQSYDIGKTKAALSYLIRKGEAKAIEHVLPLTQHPDVAIRYFAKRALRALEGHMSKSDPIFKEQERAVQEALAEDQVRERAAPTRRPKTQPRPDFFKVRVYI